MNSSDRRDDVWEQVKAVFRYELLRNLRNKTFLVIFLIAVGIFSLNLFLPPILDGFETDPNFFLENLNPGGLVIMILAVGVSMKTIAGEFESGSMELLASKPISRDVIYLGKLAALFAILLVVYIFFFLYSLGTSTWIYGPQDGLSLVMLAVPFFLALSSMVWVSVSLFLGAWTKSSVVTVLGTVGIFIGLSVAAGIVPYYSPATGEAFNYLPGEGESGELAVDDEDSPVEGIMINTGTDHLSDLFVTYSLDPETNISILEHDRGCPVTGMGGEEFVPGDRGYTLGSSLARTLMMTMVYIIGLNYLGMLLFKKSSIMRH